MASPQFCSVFQGGRRVFRFSLFYTQAGFKGFKKSGKIVENLPAGEMFPLRKQNEEERLNLAFAVLPHIFLLKEESDEFYFSDIYTRGCFEGSQNLKKILKN